MATQNNSTFYLEAVKALKLQGEQAPYGSDARKLYSTKANSLREILKTQFGMTNIDADYGAGVSLANTPGGGKIDWNVLANAADILGTSQAGSTRSAFDRALGEYLTRNLPVWQKQQATTPSSAVTSTTTSAMGGTGAAESIIGGKALTASSVNSGMQASQAVATQTARGAGTWNMGTAGGITPNSMDNVAPGFNPDGTPVGGAGGGAGGNVYGDFIKSEYFKNNDFDGYFLSVNKGLNLPTITDPTTGKVTIDWAAKDANGKPLVSMSIFNSYGNMTKLWNTMQGLSKEKDSFNAIDIEKNPVFKEQLNVLDAEMASLQKQFNLNVDAQLAGLKGSIDANKAGLEFELNTIKREIGASNWRSRQSLAASGMAFSGMLGYLYGQNEAKGMDATIRATAISAAEIKAIGQQMAILDGSKLSYASDLERIYGAKRALARAQILSPQNDRLVEIGQLLDQAISDFETEKGLVAPAAELGAREEESAAVTANYDLVKDIAKMAKDGIWLTPSADGKSFTFKIDLTDQERLDRDKFMFDQWYKTEGLNLDWANLDLDKDKLVLDKAKQAFTEWATTQGLNLDAAKLDLEWAKLVETVAARKAGGGATNPDGTPVYDQKPDLSVLSNSGAPTSATDLASLRLIVGTGALNAENFASVVDGTPYWAYTDANGKTQYVYSEAELPQNSNGWFHKASAVPNKEGKFAGIMSMNDTTFGEVLKLVTDPTMAVALATVKDMADNDTRAGSDWVTIANAYIKEYGLDGAAQSQIHDLLRTYFGK